MSLRTAALLCALGLMGPGVQAAWGDDAAPGASTLPPAFAAILDGSKDCTEITDKCVACKKDDSGWHCSTPGIACQPEAAVCAKP